MPSLHLEVLSINQNPIIDIEVSGFLNTQVASFMLDLLEDIIDVVVHTSHSVKVFLYSGGAEFVLVVTMYGTCIKAIEPFAREEFVGSGGCSTESKFCER